MELMQIVRFLFEMGQLRRIKHEGWKLAGIESPESVAEHTLRAAQIAYILAKMENYPQPEKVCAMVVFHELAEARTGDVHRVARRYVVRDEEKAVKEQLGRLGNLGEDIFRFWKEFEARNTKAAQIAKDADRLEQAVTAREYIAQGFSSAVDWINNIRPRLYTESARKLLRLIEKANPTDWWQGLKKLDDINQTESLTP